MQVIVPVVGWGAGGLVGGRWVGVRVARFVRAGLGVGILLEGGLIPKPPMGSAVLGGVEMNRSRPPMPSAA